MKRIAFIGVVFLFLLASFTAHAASNDWQEYLKRGHGSPVWTPLVESGFTAYDAGNYEMSVNFFQRAIDKGCRDGLIYFLVGTYYEDNDNLPEAKKFLEIARDNLPKRYPTNPATKAVHESVGRVLFAMGDMKGAKKELLAALDSRPPNFTVMLLLGSIARQEGNNKELIGYYKKALTLQPPPGTNTEQILITLLMEIGIAHDNLKEYDKAMEVFGQVLQRIPNHPLALQYKKQIEDRTNRDNFKSDEQKIIEQFK